MTRGHHKSRPAAVPAARQGRCVMIGKIDAAFVALTVPDCGHNFGCQSAIQNERDLQDGGGNRTVSLALMIDSAPWIEHRRGRDSELLGWMAPEGDGFVVIDLLGRARSTEVDWFTAEKTLDEIGLGFLADPFELRLPNGHWLQVRIAELSPEGIRVTRDEWSSSEIEEREFSLPFPMPENLRPKIN